MAITNFVRGGSVFKGSLVDADGTAIGGGLQVTTVTLTDDQIKALPTTPVVLVPATEVSPVTTLFMPLTAFVTVRLNAGYGNIDDTENGYAKFLLGYGSDWHDDASVETKIRLSLNQSSLGTFACPKLDSGFGHVLPIDGSYPDNALVFAAHNNGNFTDGDPANTMKVTVIYAVIDL